MSFSKQLTISKLLAALVGQEIRANARSSAPSQIRGEFRFVSAAEGSSIETPSGKLPTCTLHAYNGGPMDVGFGLPTVVDLQGMGVGPNPISILRQHDSNRVFGHSTDISTDDRSLTVLGLVSGVGPHVDEVLKTAGPNRKPKDKFPWQVSIGAKVIRAAFLDEEEEVTVNGRVITGPAIIVRESLLTEVSLVPIGADITTSASFAASSQHGGGSSTLVSLEFAQMNFSQWLKAKGFDEATLTDAVKKSLQAMYEAELNAEQEPATGEGEEEDEAPAGRRKLRVVRAAAGGDDDEDGDEEEDTDLEDDAPPARRRRRKRRQIRASGESLRDVLDNFAAGLRKELNAENTRRTAITSIPGISPEIVAKALSDNWTVERAELEVLRAERGQNVPAIHMKDPTKVSGQAIECAMAMQVGATPDSLKPDRKRNRTGYSDAVIDQAMSAEYRGFGLQTLMYEVIRAAGKHVRPGQVNEEFINAAFLADRELRAAGFTTISLTGILGAVANKALIAAYDAVATVWQHFCAIGSNSDFKVGTRYRLDSLGAFRKVGMDGKIHSAGLSEAGYTSQLDTFGLLLKLPRQLIYNDDLNAFAAIPKLMGRSAKIRQEEAFFVLLLSNPGSFFHANNRNLNTGAGSALGIAGLTASSLAFQKQVDSNGKPILTNPNRLLVPSALGVTADNLYSSELLNPSDAAANALQGERNPHRSKYLPHSSPYLDNTAIRDQDGKALSSQSAAVWYQFADPEAIAAFRMSFLNGQQTPTVTSAEGAFDELAAQWRIVHDFTCSAEDPAGAQRNNGS